MAGKPTSISAKRDAALQKVAREALRGLELAMDHPDSTREFTTAELKHALELAYEQGRKSARS
jgi:hypothetical protein